MDAMFVNENVILPAKIQVKISKGEMGAWIVEVPEFDISTETESLLDIDFLLNDLLYVYFDVPLEDRKRVRYVPVEPKIMIEENKLKAHPLYFQKFLSPDLVRLTR